MCRSIFGWDQFPGNERRLQRLVPHRNTKSSMKLVMRDLTRREQPYVTKCQTIPPRVRLFY